MRSVAVCSDVWPGWVTGCVQRRAHQAFFFHVSFNSQSSALFIYLYALHLHLMYLAAQRDYHSIAVKRVKSPPCILVARPDGCSCRVNVSVDGRSLVRIPVKDAFVCCHLPSGNERACE